MKYQPWLGTAPERTPRISADAAREAGKNLAAPFNEFASAVGEGYGLMGQSLGETAKSLVKTATSPVEKVQNLVKGTQAGYRFRAAGEDPTVLTPRKLPKKPKKKATGITRIPASAHENSAGMKPVKRYSIAQNEKGVFTNVGDNLTFREIPTRPQQNLGAVSDSRGAVTNNGLTITPRNIPGSAFDQATPEARKQFLTGSGDRDTFVPGRQSTQQAGYRARENAFASNVAGLRQRRDAERAMQKPTSTEGMGWQRKMALEKDTREAERNREGLASSERMSQTRAETARLGDESASRRFTEGLVQRRDIASENEAGRMSRSSKSIVPVTRTGKIKSVTDYLKAQPDTPLSFDELMAKFYPEPAKDGNTSGAISDFMGSHFNEAK